MRRTPSLTGKLGRLPLTHLGNLCSHISASLTNGVLEVANRSVVTIERYQEELTKLAQLMNESTLAQSYLILSYLLSSETFNC